jgi:hypothetical protein
VRIEKDKQPRFDRAAGMRKWFREKVTIVKEVDTLEIKNIMFHIDKYSGTFDAVINDADFSFEFSGSNGNGRLTAIGPWAQVSYGGCLSAPTLVIPDEAKADINRELNEYIPPLIPLGLDKNTGKIVAYHDSVSERITDMPKVLKSIALFEQDGFTIKVK